MNRLWTLCAMTAVAGGWALAAAGAATTSLWPGVGLFSVAGLLACAAACIDAAADSAKHEAEMDKRDASEVFKRELVVLAEHLEKHDQQIDHLQKKDALNALG